MSVRAGFVRSLSLILALACGPGRQNAAHAQAAEDVSIKMKLFDSNKPRTELIPKQAIVFVRNLATGQPELLPPRRIEPIEAEKGFYQVKVPADRLIEQLVITVDSASGTNFNPAVVSKIVSAAPMTIYPGASDPGDKFSFQAFTAQLNTYKTILTQLVEEFGEARRKDIRSDLKQTFGKQLQIMAEAESKGRLSGFTPEQLTTARKLLDEVLKLYGLRAEEKPSRPPVVIYPCVECYPCYPVCYPCYPAYPCYRTPYVLYRGCSGW